MNSFGGDGIVKKPRTNQMTCIGKHRCVERRKSWQSIWHLVDGYFGDPQDCRVYHVCVDGRDYRSICAPGLAWEPLLRLCMSAHLVNCPNSKSIDSSSSKQKWLQFLTRPGVKTTTTTTTTTVATPSNIPSIFTCAGRANGYYADPVHCNKFHYCGTGTVFDWM